MSDDWHAFRPGDGILVSETGLLLGEVEERGQSLAAERARPVFVLVINGLCPVHEVDEDTLALTSWRALALLAGQLKVVRETLPVHIRDQYDRIAADARRAARDGRA